MRMRKAQVFVEVYIAVRMRLIYLCLCVSQVVMLRKNLVLMEEYVLDFNFRRKRYE